MTPRGDSGATGRCTCFEGEPNGGIPEPQRFSASASGAHFDRPADKALLARAYLASAMDLALQAEALASGEACMDPGPVALQAMIAAVVATVRPCATEAGLALLRDTNSEADAVCCADPAQLHRVLVYLTLRALVAENAPGHVRIMVTVAPREAQFRILGRGTAALAPLGDVVRRHDLTAVQRVLGAMGGSLVLEPRRAGYLPLCVALRALAPAASQRAG